MRRRPNGTWNLVDPENLRRSPADSPSRSEKAKQREPCARESEAAAPESSRAGLTARVPEKLQRKRGHLPVLSSATCWRLRCRRRRGWWRPDITWNLAVQAQAKVQLPGNLTKSEGLSTGVCGALAQNRGFCRLFPPPTKRPKPPFQARVPLRRPFLTRFFSPRGQLIPDRARLSFRKRPGGRWGP